MQAEVQSVLASAQAGEGLEAWTQEAGPSSLLTEVETAAIEEAVTAAEAEAKAAGPPPSLSPNSDTELLKSGAQHPGFGTFSNLLNLNLGGGGGGNNAGNAGSRTNSTSPNSNFRKNWAKHQYATICGGESTTTSVNGSCMCQ